MYAGVDPSLTSTGLVVLSNTGQVLEKRVVKPKKDLVGSTLGQVARLIYIENEIIDTLVQLSGVNPVYIGYEHYSYGSINKPFKLGELGGVLKTSFYKWGWGQIHISPSVLKKFAVDDGHASKDRVKEQAIMEANMASTMPDDIYDAYFLAKFAWYVQAPQDVINYEVDEARNLLRGRLELILDKFKFDFNLQNQELEEGEDDGEEESRSS